MSFYTYMLENYLTASGPKRDLASDMKSDFETFPRNTTKNLQAAHARILGYLQYHHACLACLEVFEECWSEYVDHCLSQRETPSG
ncbi:YozE family protein [Actinotignum urinale]|uniref:YozE family protein n=1 Tax=Actinotignum urinale TaxID=190146 RepID=UPI0003FA1A7F|nr:YozE family protein [Actinotignum urinale]MDY5159664.1 YozE family protein [Actinotignum urinale]